MQIQAKGPLVHSMSEIPKSGASTEARCKSGHQVRRIINFHQELISQEPNQSKLKVLVFLTDPVLTFSAKENSRSFPALDDGIELDSFTDVDVGETTESKATKSKIKTEVEENYPSTNCRLFLLII